MPNSAKSDLRKVSRKWPRESANLRTRIRITSGIVNRSDEKLAISALRFSHNLWNPGGVAEEADVGNAPQSGNPAQGKSVFASNGCGACHIFKPAGSSGSVGPNLDSAPALDAKKDNMPLPAFIRESIVSPNTYISPGYPKSVMPQNFGSTLTKTQLAELVAFIAAGSK